MFTFSVITTTPLSISIGHYQMSLLLHMNIIYIYYFTRKHISTNKLVKMAQFVLKNNFFEFNNDVSHQISGTTIVTQFRQPCIFMDQIETKFLITQSYQSVVTV